MTDVGALLPGWEPWDDPDPDPDEHFCVQEVEDIGPDGFHYQRSDADLYGPDEHGHVTVGQLVATTFGLGVLLAVTAWPFAVLCTAALVACTAVLARCFPLDDWQRLARRNRPHPFTTTPRTRT